jgi:hypothetical protein
VAQLLYFAPEVLRGKSFTKECDVYSYGFLIWMLFEPEASDIVSELSVAKHFSGIAPTFAKSQLPVSIQSMIEACCQESPNMRPAIDKVVNRWRAELEAFGSSIDGNAVGDYLSRIDAFRAFSGLRTSAECGKLQALYQYGKKARSLIAWTPDANPRVFLDRAAKGGHPKAEYLYGRLLVEGYFGETVARYGASYIEGSADKGLTDAVAYLQRNPFVRRDSSALRKMPLSASQAAVNSKKEFQTQILTACERRTASLIEELSNRDLDRTLFASTCVDIAVIRSGAIKELGIVIKGIGGMEEILLARIVARLGQSCYPHEIVASVQLLSVLDFQDFTAVWQQLQSLAGQGLLVVTALLAFFGDHIQEVAPSFASAADAQFRETAAKAHPAVKRFFEGKVDSLIVVTRSNINDIVAPSIRDPLTLLFDGMTYFQYGIISRTLDWEVVTRWKAHYLPRQWGPSIAECVAMGGDLGCMREIPWLDPRDDGVAQTAARFFSYSVDANTDGEELTKLDRCGNQLVTAAAASNNLSLLVGLGDKVDYNQPDGRTVFLLVI